MYICFYNGNNNENPMKFPIEYRIQNMPGFCLCCIALDILIIFANPTEIVSSLCGAIRNAKWDLLEFQTERKDYSNIFIYIHKYINCISVKKQRFYSPKGSLYRQYFPIF